MVDKNMTKDFRKYYNDEALSIGGRKFEWIYREGEYVQNTQMQEKIKCLDKLSHCNSFLDVGCGDGHFIKFVKEKFGQDTYCVGLDISQVYLDVARKNLPNAKFICGNAQKELRLIEDNSFDLVLCSEVLEHVVNPRELFHELLRVTRDTLIITTPRKSLFRVITDFCGYHIDPFKYKGGHISEISYKNIIEWIDNKAKIVYFKWDCYIPNGLIKLLKLPDSLIENINFFIRKLPYLNQKLPILQLYVIKKNVTINSQIIG